MKIQGNCCVSVLSVNLAYRKKTVQSSTGVARYGISSHAVDGNRNNKFVAKSCTMTSKDNNSWWQVDLAGVYEVNRIAIIARGDCSTCGKFDRCEDSTAIRQ